MEITPVFCCRLCKKEITQNPKLVYQNMPSCSQYLPETPDNGGIELRIVECPACGLVQLQNQPVSYYREVIRATAYSPEMELFRKKQFADWATRNQLAGKNILEVGCGKGEYLSLMQKYAGVNAFGVEAGRDSVQTAQHAGLNVEQGFFEDGNERLSSAPFDGFFILNYLEHIPEPDKFLHGIYQNLKYGAVGLVEVPNFGMMLKNNMFSEFTIDHLCYFTEATLRRILEINGFDIISCRSIWHDYIISAEVRKRQSTDFSNFSGAAENLFSEINDFCADSPRDEVAVWGAGHQAFALLAAGKLASKVDCIIDSAKFKHGHYSPASALKILPPEILKDKKIRKIIIIAGAYSDEISSQIRTTYGNHYSLEIVRENHLEIL